MRFMNTWEIDEKSHRHAGHPVLGLATRTLASLRDAADANSDGWCYWPKPARAAEKLMELIESGGEVTADQLVAAYRPLKSFRTRSGLKFDIFEPGVKK
jgi:hypothetical protein